MLRQVHPQLQSHVRRPVRILAGHLGVHDPPSGGHELQVARVDGPLVPRKVLVVDPAGEEVGDGFLAPVGVVGKAGAWFYAEMVEHEEGGEIAKLGGADAAADAGARALGLLGGEEDLADGAGDYPGGGHVEGYVWELWGLWSWYCFGISR